MVTYAGHHFACQSINFGLLLRVECFQFFLKERNVPIRLPCLTQYLAGGLPSMSMTYLALLRMRNSSRASIQREYDRNVSITIAPRLSAPSASFRGSARQVLSRWMDHRLMASQRIFEPQFSMNYDAEIHVDGAAEHQQLAVQTMF